MTSIAVTFEGLDAAKAKLAALSHLDFHVLLESLAVEGMEQTRRRLEEEKTSPAGVAWKPTLDGRGALFVTGALARSVGHASTATQAVWGVPAEPVSGRPYARIHNFGGVIRPKNARVLSFEIGGKRVFAKTVTIPQREYLGVSDANARDLEATAAKFIERRWR